MSYRHSMGLGQAPSGPLPPFSSLPKEGVRYGVEWALVSDDAVLEQIKRILVAAKAMASDEAIRNGEGKLTDEGAFITALGNLWFRNGKNPALWPSEFREAGINFNFGPTNNGGTQLRINEAMWNLLQSMSPAKPWAPYYAGKERDIAHSRVRLSDPLLRRDIRNRLVQLGYIDAKVDPNVADGSEFSEAIKRYYTEARQQSLPVGSWAGWTASGGCGGNDVFGECINYGPNVDGTGIRLHVDLLDSLVNGLHNPRLALTQQAAREAVLATRVKPPLYGSLPGEKAPAPKLSAAAFKTASTALAPALKPSTLSLLQQAIKK